MISLFELYSKDLNRTDGNRDNEPKNTAASSRQKLVIVYEVSPFDLSLFNAQQKQPTGLEESLR